MLEFDNIENIKRAVEIPAGVSVLPEPSLRVKYFGSLAAVRITGQDPNYQLNRPLAIIHRRNDNLDMTASRFLELLTESDIGKPAGRSSGTARTVAASPRRPG